MRGVQGDRVGDRELIGLCEDLYGVAGFLYGVAGFVRGDGRDDRVSVRAGISSRRWRARDD